MKRTHEVSSTMVQTEQDVTGSAAQRGASPLAPRPWPVALIRLALLLLLPALLWLATPQDASALPRIWYVDKDAGGADDGTSWADAYSTLQAALDVANANAGTNYEIWVAEGTYYPDEGGSHVDNSQEEYFVITNDNVQLYGGFGGDETDRTQRDWRAHPTVLSGDIDQDGALTNNAYHVLYLDGVTDPNITAATVIDGFTITGGNATGEDPHNNGGGLYCYGYGSENECSPTIANSILNNHQASGSGGAMYNNGFLGTSSPSLVNVIFSGNQVNQSGGAMYNNGFHGTSSPSLVNVIFSGNQANQSGGAMYNTGVNSGASSPRLTSVTFSGNQASTSGGAMYNQGGPSGTSSPSLINVILWGNTATSGAQIANDIATPSISYSLVPSTTTNIYNAFSTITWGSGNITAADANPLFVTPISATSAPTTTGNYRLQGGAPAIDAGSNLSVTVTTDLDGNPRIANGVVDMGAYEVAILYVDKDRLDGAHFGLSWTDAFTNVQDALGVANANAGTRYEIWVAEGTYYPDEGAGAIDNSRTMSFTLRYDNVQLYGGFGGDETERTQRDWRAHPTVLSGDIDQDGALTNNAYHVLYLDGVTDPNITAATVIDGFTVTGGNAETYPNYNGGGLYCAGNGSGNACSPTIANVAFNGNRANMYGGAMYNGGASGGTSSPTLTNVTYSGNWAYSGGAMCNWGESGDSSPTLMNVVFAGNSAEEGGGAISNDGQGGRSSPTLTNVTISGNYGGTNGGGMYNYAPSGTSVPRLTNVILWGNWARFGPQIDGLGATATISYSLVQGGYTGVGNFDLDPQFVVPITATVAPTTTGNYRLQTGSPAIDAGNNGAVLAGVDTDLDGNPRIVNGVVDMGAYEKQPGPALGMSKQVTPATNVPYQGVVTYTLTLSNSGNLTATAALTDALPAQVAFGGWVANPGAEQAGNVITWSGPITPATALTYVFTATHSAGVGVITNTATFSGSLQAGSADAAFTALCSPAITVQNAADSGVGSLRQAIADVCPGGVVDFSLSYPATITLTSAQLTVLKDMTIAGPGAANLAVSGANARRVFSVTTGVNVTLDGLTIRDGNAGAEDGGGIYNSGVLTLTNSSVLSNTANRGSGMYNDRTSPVVTSVTFSGNHALAGGTMYNNGYNGVSSPTLANVIFSGNQVEFGSGGAMYNAGAAGGVSSPSLTKVTFSGNRAGADGGAMYNTGNTGGASSPSLVDVTFSGNQASNGGAMYNINVSSPSLIDVTFTGNQAEFGGAIVNYGSTSRTSMVNVTFSGNRAGNKGGAMYNAQSSPSLINVILWGNSANGGGAQMANIAATPSIHHSLIPSTTADILDILGGAITWGDGNLTDSSIDPLFVAPIAAGSAPTTTGDYRLRACSPAIDAGDNLSVTVATDLDGNPRIVNGVVDMGAYEAALMPCLHLAKAVTPTTNVAFQGIVTYTLTLSNSGVLTDTAALTDALPAEVAFGGWVANPGAEQTGNVITWSGEMTPAAALTYVFTATHTGAANVTVTNTAEFSGALQAGQASATFATVKANTTTVLTSTPNPSSYREQIAFTVTVSAPGGGTPTGVVTFTTTTGELGVRSLTDGVATFETALLAVGTHVITATYGGDGNYQVSAATPVTQTVNRANTTTALTSAPNASAFGQAVTFTATVTVNAPGAGAPTGVVTFTTASGDLGTGNLADGAATVSTSSLGIGSHIITATYGGDGNFADSSASLTQVVARSATAVDFTPAPNPAQYGEMVRTAITVTARHILPAGELSVQRPLGPGGVVTLYDGVDAVTTAVVVGGVATVAWPLPATGAHTLTVIYSGDAFHAGGVSAPGTLLVAKTATTSTLAAPPAATLYGAPAPFTVTVQSALVQSAGNAPPTPARPTGQVQIQAGDVVLGVGVLVEGVAVIDVGLLAGGVRTLTAAYAGDANYLASTAAAIQHTVLPAPAQTSLVAAPNPAAIHTPVTFTATVQAAPLIHDGLTTQVGLATPTGQVIFQSGATVLGSGALANGVATVTTDGLAFDDHAITAHYSGDANYQAAVSAVLTQSISAPTPLAVNDAAGVLEGEAVTIAVLANDHDPAGGGLTVVAVTQPAHGAASIDPGGATVRYAAAGGGGVDSFTYTLQDVHGQQCTATVAVVVTVLTETDAPPQVAVLDPAVQSTTHFTSSQATVAVDAPAGVYTGTLTPAQVFFLSYTPIVTPTAHTLTPPGTLQFGNFEFELTAFRDDQPLHGLVFAQPVVLTIRYNPLLLSSLEPATLGLYFWDGTGWSTDGIVILSHDPTTATLTVEIAHPGDFVFFAVPAPTDLNPAPEPDVNGSTLYLPAVMRAASDTVFAPPMESVAAPSLAVPMDHSPNVNADANSLYLPELFKQP